MVNLGTYFSQVVRELKKVSWPSREQTLNNTILVIVVSVLLAIYLGGLDFSFQELVAQLIK